ncbi:MAG: AGE family epimerase/isomerase [Bacteroidales bacterium]|nr:AGE family epimerase/isomerase [Bacteroidales bacterium]
MKKFLLFFVLQFGIGFPMLAQYNTNCQYLNEPGLLIDYVKDCAGFWSQTKDLQYGGYFMDIDRSGNVLNTNKKGLVSLSRNAYGFSKAFMLTGDTAYLAYAKTALDFMSNHLWDNTYGGWYATSNRNGSNPYLGSKKAFDQHYALLGLMAYWEATQDTLGKQTIDNGLAFVESALWDDRDSLFGYFDVADRNGQNGNGKSFNATVDAITTHLWNLWLLTGSENYHNRLLSLRDNVLTKMIPTMVPSGIGFAEMYNSNWIEKTAERRTIIGHVLKTAWCLNRIYKMTGDQETLEAAKMLVDHVLAKGYDHTYGGPYKDYDRFTGDMYMYGAYDTAKAWWQVEQAITSGLLLWETTREVKYLKMADESLDFFMRYFVDDQYGEVYADRAREGGRVYYSGGYWDENKGSQGKAAYHSIETAYYSYLYAKLVLQRDTATLYYDYKSAPYERVLSMNPLAVDFEKLQIASVKHNNQMYTNYNAISRLLTVPANTAGLFAVSYHMIGLPDHLPETNTQAPVKLLPAYPNPFNNEITIAFELQSGENVQIEWYNQIGSLVESVDLGSLAPGRNSWTWQKPANGSGIYLCVIKTASFCVVSKCLAY